MFIHTKVFFLYILVAFDIIIIEQYLKINQLYIYIYMFLAIFVSIIITKERKTIKKGFISLIKLRINI